MIPIVNKVTNDHWRMCHVDAATFAVFRDEVLVGFATMVSDSDLVISQDPTEPIITFPALKMRAAILASEHNERGQPDSARCSACFIGWPCLIHTR